jgi:hypothetical protein
MSTVAEAVAAGLAVSPASSVEEVISAAGALERTFLYVDLRTEIDGWYRAAENVRREIAERKAARDTSEKEPHAS